MSDATMGTMGAAAPFVREVTCSECGAKQLWRKAPGARGRPPQTCAEHRRKKERVRTWEPWPA